MSELLGGEMITGLIIGLPLIALALNFRPRLTREVRGKVEEFSPQMVFDDETGEGNSVENAINKGLITRDQVPYQPTETLHNYAHKVITGKVKNPHQTK